MPFSRVQNILLLPSFQMLPMTIFGFKWSWRFWFTFPEKGFNIVTSFLTFLKPFSKREMEMEFFTFFALFPYFLKPFSGNARYSFEIVFSKVLFVWSFFKNTLQLLFVRSRQFPLKFLNILNVLNVSIWTFN